MSALDDIAAATTALNGLTTQEAAEKARIDAAVAAALAAIVTPIKSVYLDAVAGLDTNDGSTPAKAVKTPQGAAALISAGQVGVILLLSDVTLAAPLPLVGNVVIQSAGALGDGSGAGGSTVRTLTVTPGAVLVRAAPVPSIAIYTNGEGHLTLYALRLAIGPITTASGILGGTRINLSNCAVTFDPGQTSPLIYPSTGAEVFFDNTSLPAGYGGKLFTGVSVGANPNSTSLRTNITAG